MSTDLLASLTRLAQDLRQAQAQWALIGGFAVSARAEPRFTRDVDVCVWVEDDAGAERTTYALRALGYRVEALVEHRYLDRLATVRLESPIPGGVLVDLLFASSGIEAEIVAAAEAVELVPGSSYRFPEPRTWWCSSSWPATPTVPKTRWTCARCDRCSPRAMRTRSGGSLRWSPAADFTATVT